jgi:hypothetical protein
MCIPPIIPIASRTHPDRKTGTNLEKMCPRRRSQWVDISNWCEASPFAESSEPFPPGKVEEINFTMPDINHTFRRGHRIMVQVQSSWFPLTDRNPQTFVNIPDAKPADFVKATERVYHTKGEASGILVEEVSGREAVPER